jgi:hypothetical protein
MQWQPIISNAILGAGMSFALLALMKVGWLVRIALLVVAVFSLLPYVLGR